jgi:hypothetical protein
VVLSVGGMFTPAADMLLSCILAVDDSQSLRPELVSLIKKTKYGDVDQTGQ